MFIMGDVLAVVAGVLGVGTTLWAAILIFGVLFGNRARRAAAIVEQGWAGTVGVGALVAATAGLVSIVLTAQANGLFKLIGWVSLVALLSLAILGSAGLSFLAAKRLSKLSPTSSSFTSLGRSAALLITAGFLPALGWFGFAPILLFLSLGAGVRATLARTPAIAKIPTDNLVRETQ